MATNPTLLTQPIAANGAKNVIPNTTTTPGAMSQDQGFPAETSLPLGAGGVAPSREDFNGAFNLLSAQNFMTQKGWVYTFDAAQDYFAGCIVRDTTDGKLYECLNDVAAGGSVPSADAVNWQPFGGAGMLYLRESSKAYAVGDIAYNENLPSYMHLLCTTGGTTGATEPDFTGAQIGGTISDGTVVWTYAAFADRSHTVINSYYDSGTGDWWRQYADGWIEQGGNVNKTATGSYSVVFLKPYASSSYTMTVGGMCPASNNAYAPIHIKSKSTTGFDCYVFYPNLDQGWVAAGMGASV